MGDSRLKSSEASFSADNFRPEVANDVISGMIVDPTSLKVFERFGDSMSSRSRDIRLSHFATDERTPVIT